MARANLPAPETISGERSLGTPFADLSVKANPFSTFKNPQGLNIPDMPTDNSLSQLGAALTQFNPKLATIASQNIERVEKVDAATAQAQFAKTKQDYAEAVEQKIIPAGASRAYVAAYKATELNSKMMLHGVKQHQAYEESGLKDSDDPVALENFLNKFDQEYRQGALMREGKDRYTPLEIASSKFDEGMQGHRNSLAAQHIQYRADERTKLGKETAQTNIGLHIDSLYDSTDSNSHAAVAEKIKESVYGPNGVGSNGVPKSEANRLIIDTIASKMVESGDESMADIAKLIGTSQGNNLAGSVYARNKFKEASDAIMTSKIRNSNWNWTERGRQAEEAAGVTPEAEAQRKAQLWKEHDDSQALQAKDRLTKDTVDHTKAQSSSAVSYILKGLELKDMNSPHVKKSFDWLRDNDPDKWQSMTTWVASYKKEKLAFHETPASLFAAVKLRYDMSKDPMRFDEVKILNAANNGTISGEKALGLLDDWDRAKTNVDNPFIENPQFGKLLQDIRRVAVKDQSDEYGPGAINAMRADQALRTNAYAWIAANPKGTQADFMKEMRSQAEGIALDYSPEFAKDEARKQEKKVNPKPVPQKDTRSAMEKVLPNVMGGKSKPEAVTPAPTGPQPLKPSEGFSAMKPEAQKLIKKMMLDPETDETELEAAIYNSGLYAFMKSNGRTPAEFKALKDELVKQRKK